MSQASEDLRSLRQFGPEHFADLEALIEERDVLLKALTRLSAAAMTRDNVMGDQCALFAAQAELRDANKLARVAMAKATGSAA